LIWLILHKGVRYEERGPAVTKQSKHSSTPGSAKPIFRTVSKLTVLLGIGASDYPQEQEPFQDMRWGANLLVEKCGFVRAEGGIPTSVGWANKRRTRGQSVVLHNCPQ